MRTGAGKEEAVAMRKSIRLMLLISVLLMCMTSASSAAPLVVLGRAEDAEAFCEAWSGGKEVAMLILQKASDKAKRNAVSVLEAAGFSDVTFLNMPAIRESKLSEKTLERNWGKETSAARIASLIRQKTPDSLVFYSENETLHAFLHEYVKQCAMAAWNPDIRYTRQKEDEYIWQTESLADGMSGDAETLVYEDWRSVMAQKYGEKVEPVLEGLPAVDSEGYPVQGEYVSSAPEAGVWAYLSPTLRIVITRHEIKGLSWFEADIRRKPDGDYLHIIRSGDGRDVKPEKLARSNQLVLGINADYYKYRINYRMLVGLIVRNRNIVRDFHQTTTGTSLPPLDTLALNEEGMFEVDRAGVLDGEKALAMNARDVLSFGPILVKDGKLRMLLPKYRGKLEPRTAIGQIEPNHYLAVVAEGRLKSSKGISLNDLAKLMYLRGCTEAINLDGGHTSVLFFMGERLNRIGNLSGDGTSAPRNTAELLGIGSSSQVSEAEQ